MDKKGALLEIFSKEELERTVCFVSLMGGLRGPENFSHPAGMHCIQDGLTKIKPGSCLMKATNNRSETENMQRPRKEGSFRD